MFLGDIARTGIYICNISNIQPFIYRGYTKYYSLKTEWGSSCDDLFDVSKSVNVIQCSQNFINKLLKVNTYNDMIAQEGSWYFDITNKSVYLHATHDSSPITTIYDYGYGFGVSSNGVVYINDFCYLPIVKSYPEIEIEADYVGQSEPTGIVGSVTLNNLEYSYSDKPVGVVDFLLNESIVGNDFIMYDYTDGVLTELETFGIDSVSQSLTECVINLQDKRMQ